jgi:hypothetical protein
VGNCLSGSGQVRFHPLTVSCAGNAVIDIPKNSKQEKQQTGGHDFAVRTSLLPGVLASLRLCVQICGTVCLASSLMLPARNESRKDAKTQGRQEEKTAEKKRFFSFKIGN